MSTYEELPHITKVDTMTRSQLVELYERIEVDVRSIRGELSDARERRELGLSVDPEWERRARYGKSQRERLLIRARARLRDLRREELGGDPEAMEHRQWLHAIWAVVSQLPDQRLSAEILFKAKTIGAHPKGCSHCGILALDGVDGAQEVTEHIDPKRAEPPIVSDLTDRNVVPPALSR